ncbi:unnamed protein product [Prorocentrum cordatum]|uniref:Uncharacterized protein n=1 Tax=Prorocentrum cordatum TaxID=2364126 RepID=A0ABN9VUS0_9DINO|nr:unnamed protein product [Polarella glacialis]
MRRSSPVALPRSSGGVLSPCVLTLGKQRRNTAAHVFSTAVAVIREAGKAELNSIQRGARHRLLRSARLGRRGGQPRHARGSEVRNGARLPLRRPAGAGLHPGEQRYSARRPPTATAAPVRRVPSARAASDAVPLHWTLARRRGRGVPPGTVFALAGRMGRAAEPRPLPLASGARWGEDGGAGASAVPRAQPAAAEPLLSSFDGACDAGHSVQEGVSFNAADSATLDAQEVVDGTFVLEDGVGSVPSVRRALSHGGSVGELAPEPGAAFGGPGTACSTTSAASSSRRAAADLGVVGRYLMADEAAILRGRSEVVQDVDGGEVGEVLEEAEERCHREGGGAGGRRVFPRAGVGGDRRRRGRHEGRRGAGVLPPVPAPDGLN